MMDLKEAVNLARKAADDTGATHYVIWEKTSQGFGYYYVTNAADYRPTVNSIIKEIVYA